MGLFEFMRKYKGRLEYNEEHDCLRLSCPDPKGGQDFYVAMKVTGQDLSSDAAVLNEYLEPSVVAILREMEKG